MLSHQPMHQNNNKIKTKCLMLKKYGSAYLHKFICNKKQHAASVWMTQLLWSKTKKTYMAIKLQNMKDLFNSFVLIIYTINH